MQRVGRLVLDRNPDNFFAEAEQVAFHPGHIVPGIDFTNDPLLQGRLFSYTDTQLLRLGGPNFHEIPINRPVAPVHNNQRDGHMRQTIGVGQTSYDPNTLGGGCPFQAGARAGGFVSYPERIDDTKRRARGEKFFDHFGFVAEAYKHCKALAATGAGVSLLPTENGAHAKAGPVEEGVIGGGDGDVAKVAAEFIKSIAQHRAWSREAKAERLAV